MIRDFDQRDAALPDDYDVCIVGTGPAGTTVANELAGSGLRVAMLESGRLRPTQHGDALRRVTSEGIFIKDYSRERVLGGASTTWAGLSSPLDACDLAQRAYLRESDWPIEHAELMSLYAQAAERYRFPALEMFGANGPRSFGAMRKKGALQPTWSRVEEKVFLAASEPQNFGREFRALFDSSELDVWLDATLVELDGERDGSRVREGVVRSSGGREARLRARVFVIATGGIENACLLLRSKTPWKQGLGNEHDQVGRWMMNHPKNYRGILELARPVDSAPYFFGCLHQGFAGYAGLRLPEDVQREQKLLNSYIRLEPLFPWSDNRGVESLVLLVKKSNFFRRWKEKRAGEVVELRDYSETGDDSDLQNERKNAAGWLALTGEIVRNAPSVAAYAHSRLVRRRKPPIQRARLRNFIEMEPDPENRVVLGEERDAYGQPRAIVRHRCTERDQRSLLALHEALVDDFTRAGIGTLHTDLATAKPWPIDQDASHHMGTTRMGRNPKTSVADANGRVHSVENVYMAGASLFPTSGCANPTFTIVALSIRLARHLREEVFGKSSSRAAEARRSR
jgi:choline dehydrogenase-like flavoprotein